MILPVLLALLLPGCTTSSERTARAGDPVAQADTVVWVGLDYSMVRMIGTADFRQPDKIFPTMFDTWNYLFLREDYAVRAGRELNKKVVLDTTGVSQRNRLATPDQIIRMDGDKQILSESHITPLDIAEAVRSYELKEGTGIGLVFIIDRLVKLPEQGCVYLVVFDVATREVIRSERGCYDAGGAGFRNYWFSVVKDAVSDVSDLR